MTLETAAVDTAAPEVAPEAAEPAKEKPAKSKTIRETLETATKAVDAQEAVSETESAARVLRGESEYPEEKPKPKPVEAKKAEKTADTKAEEKPKAEAKEDAKADEAKGAERDESGRFKSNKPAEVAPEPATEAAKEPSSQSRAYERLNEAARAEWDNTPESVRTEFERAVENLEGGLEKHREGAEKYAKLERFEGLAKQYGGTIEAALEDYAGMAQKIRENPLAVFETLAQRHGYSMEQVASHYLNRDLSEYAKQTDETIRSLQATVNEQARQLSEYNAQKTEAVGQTVQQFANSKPRFQELRPEIEFQLSQQHPGKPSEPAEALAWAYNRAETLNPAPASPGTLTASDSQTLTAS